MVYGRDRCLPTGLILIFVIFVGEDPIILSVLCGVHIRILLSKAVFPSRIQKIAKALVLD